MYHLSTPSSFEYIRGSAIHSNKGTHTLLFGTDKQYLCFSLRSSQRDPVKSGRWSSHPLSNTNLLCIRSEGYVTVGINLVSKPNDLSLSEIIHTRVVSVIHKVVYGWAKNQHRR